MPFIRLLLFMSVWSTASFAQSFHDTYALIQKKNFFKAKAQYQEHRQSYSATERNILEAFILNAFNKPSHSNRTIAQLNKKATYISDTIMMELLKIQVDNYIKNYQYKEAKNGIEKLLDGYSNMLSAKETNNLNNLLKIWSTFQNEPPQKVRLNNPDSLALSIDKAGLKNLEINIKTDTALFIFDTGANISSVTQSVAKKLKMKLFPVTIEVGTITGNKTNAQLAICPVLYLGKIEIQNAIFLVFNDESLYIQEIDYQINGILGFPVIEALGEVKISQNGFFSVAKNPKSTRNESNMALDGLFPLICLDGKHYTFDTGADETILYEAYYLAYKEEIDRKYTKEQISFAGAGGTRSFEGYSIDFTFKINGKEYRLNQIQLLTEKLKPTETVYGNVGQDVIQKFNAMTINFERMFIKFE